MGGRDAHLPSLHSQANFKSVQNTPSPSGRHIDAVRDPNNHWQIRLLAAYKCNLFTRGTMVLNSIPYYCCLTVCFTEQS